jgi:anti-sigma B factor antagonist
MTVKMTNSEVEGVSVVALDGRIVLGEESNALREKVKGLIAEGKKKIVLNMANIKYIDSAGLGTLVGAHVSAKKQGASVRLCNLGTKFHEVMQITKLLTVFDVYDTEAAAVSSFEEKVRARTAGIASSEFVQRPTPFSSRTDKSIGKVNGNQN